ncbi:uncharacterized protein E0L32_003700 [Thyridium curvatum]|uniref:Uncharacterized protein n=1 Tax=Thyridium curvatum TaxID=1093900 RepID=A0A507BHF0_9PEZI|nr:uncharacterized protein E0L32_003700 [Thyridium curvatum]TPX16759.1 hypothetical protein E0L32_003700 [Thyridium curvatum]
MAPSEFQGQHGNLQSGGRTAERTGRVDAPSQSQRRNDESWVEIASQPSSSSLSSIGDEIVTTGLRVGVGRASYPPQQPIRRRRLLQLQQRQMQQRQQQQQHTSMPQSYFVSHAAAQGGMSSQEEYDETESEEDRVMTSSTENVPAPTPGLAGQPATMGPAADSDTDSDDDENATALGRPSDSPTFRPQPNAFSHPPNHLQHRSHSTNSSVPYHPPYGRPSVAQRSQTRVNRSGPSFMSPHTREDNDEALRASLTTLLSCAAAARGLPKKDETATGPSGIRSGLRPSTQPTGLQLVQESELMDDGPAAAATGAAAPRLAVPPERKLQSRTASNSSAPSGPISTSSRAAADAAAAAGEKSKRSASATQTTKSSRASKKKKTSAAVLDEEHPASISPTLLTWVVGAGVVVLVSVVGFGAGYVIGREVGRQEGASAMGFNGLGGGGGGAGAAVNASSSCGSELVRSGGSGTGGTLRRFRWGGGIGGSVAA